MPTQEILKVCGKVSYNESAQAWNTIKIKKEVFLIFPQLKDKRSEFNYTMVIPRTNEEVKEKFESLSKEQKIPILLFFEKDIKIE